MIAEGSLQRREGGLAGAVAGGDVLDFESIMQRGYDLLDVRVASHDEVKATSDEADARVDRAGRLDDSVDTGMRTANHNDHALGRAEGQGQFAQLERTRLIGDQCN